ncbi:MAG: SDR family oxidoreductase [Sphingomonadaceae bacterium]|nr:SDR family oxidoreductase [Sphingomonadaceae bacterium]
MAAGVRHHVALSVVGTDRLQDSGYFRAKLAQEKMIASSPIPYSLVHATQFFEFIRTIADLSTEGGVVRLPPVRFQPMAAEDVAGAIAEIALGAPVNGTIEIGGPEMFTLDAAVRKVLLSDHDGRQVIADASAPYYGVQVTDRELVPDPGARLGSTGLDWWIEHVPPPPRPAAAAAAAAAAVSVQAH